MVIRNWDQPTLGSLPIFAKMVNIGKPPIFTSKNRAENLRIRKIIEKRDSCHGEKKPLVIQQIPSGKHTEDYGKSPFLMGISTISMAIFHSYVSLPEGSHGSHGPFSSMIYDELAFLKIAVLHGYVKLSENMF